MDGKSDNSYIIEFTKVGGSVKVTAIDPVSLREVSMVGSAKLRRKELAELAVRKLKYVLAKEA